MPRAFFSQSPKNIATDRQLPVLIYMHGCTGIYHKHDVLSAREIASHGFIVVLPDSMAKPGRLSNCDPSIKGSTQRFPQAYRYRQQEITYALDQIRQSAWADRTNIFLMGHSEGGIATAQSTHDAWNAQVISGWTCTSGTPQFGGIHSPPHIPVFAVAYLDDLWRKGKDNEGRCADHADGHRVTQLDLNGNEHETFSNTAARHAVVQFIKSHLRP